MSAMWSISKTD